MTAVSVCSDAVCDQIYGQKALLNQVRHPLPPVQKGSFSCSGLGYCTYAEAVGDICKEVIAFANTKDGTLYIGVSNDGNAPGIKNADQVILHLNKWYGGVDFLAFGRKDTDVLRFKNRI